MCAYDVHNYDAQQHRAGQIISPLTLQTITIAQMLSVGGEGVHSDRTDNNRLFAVEVVTGDGTLTDQLHRISELCVLRKKKTHQCRPIKISVYVVAVYTIKKVSYFLRQDSSGASASWTSNDINILFLKSSCLTDAHDKMHVRFS